ncbi:MAG: hypothetical protein H6772_04045 [Pseudomonadales bacterium]|nr:hypothetical protein [Pseudomonadales bacterium]
METDKINTPTQLEVNQSEQAGPLHTTQPPQTKNMKVWMGVGILLLFVISAGSYRLGQNNGKKSSSITDSKLETSNPIETDNAVACTADVKECPDGSFVGRVAPNCEFEDCGNTIDDQETEQTIEKNSLEEGSNVLLYKNDIFGFMVEYPISYTVVDKLQLDNAEWRPDKDLTFIDDQNIKNPSISLRLDYDGYGVSFPLEIWKIIYDELQQKLIIENKEVQDRSFIKEATGEDISNVLIVTGSERTIFSDKQRSLSFILKYEGEKDLEIENQFEAFIESFKLVK